MSGAHVISIDVRSCVSVSVFTSDTGQTVTRPGSLGHEDHGEASFIIKLFIINMIVRRYFIMLCVMWLERAGPGAGVGAVEGSGGILCTNKTKCGGN